MEAFRGDGLAGYGGGGGLLPDGAGFVCGGGGFLPDGAGFGGGGGRGLGRAGEGTTMGGEG